MPEEATVNVDVFIVYAPEDRRWVRVLAENLHRLGLEVFFDAWSIMPGDVRTLRLEDGLRRARAAVLVVSPASADNGWVAEQYAALMRSAVAERRRLVPILLGGEPGDGFLASREYVDFRGARGSVYEDKVHELAALLGRQSPRAAIGAPLVPPPIEEGLVAPFRDPSPAVSGVTASDLDSAHNGSAALNVSSRKATFRERVREVIGGLEGLLRDELLRHLGHPDVISLQGLRRRYDVIAKDQYLSPLVPNFEWLRPLLLGDRRAQARFGLADRWDILRDYSRKHPLTVAITPSLIGAAAIFTFLRDSSRYGLNLRLNYAYSHAAQLVNLALRGDSKRPDGMATILAPACRIIGRKRAPFQPVAVLPAQSYRVVAVATRTSPVPGRGDYFTPLADHTGASLQIQRLAERTTGRQILRTAVDIYPTEALYLLPNADVGSKFLLWSPHWRLAESLGLATPLADVSVEQGWEDCIFLIAEAIVRRHPLESDLLTLAIRSAWLDLLENPNDLNATVQYLLADRHYITCFLRMLGVSSLLLDRS